MKKNKKKSKDKTVYRLNIKELKWVDTVIDEARRENLAAFFGRDESGGIVCYMYHKGNGFLLKALHFKKQHKGE